MAQRIRVTYAKTEPLRYTGNLDMQRSWERTIRRAGLPIAYSQGFHPQPRLQQACALPLGFTSQCEMLDLWLETEGNIDLIDGSLRQASPPGVEIIQVVCVTPKAPPLQTQVVTAEYQVTILESLAAEDLPARAAQLLTADHLPRRWRDKDYDLRPLIEGLGCLTPEADCLPSLWMRLSAREAATGRPEEVLSVLGLPIESARVHRTHLYFISDSNSE